MTHHLKKIGLTLLFAFLSAALTQGAEAQQMQILSVPPDSPRWVLEGQANTAEYKGRKSLYLNGGGATLKDLELGGGWGLVCRVADAEQKRLGN